MLLLDTWCEMKMLFQDFRSWGSCWNIQWANWFVMDSTRNNLRGTGEPNNWRRRENHCWRGGRASFYHREYYWCWFHSFTGIVAPGDYLHGCRVNSWTVVCWGRYLENSQTKTPHCISFWCCSQGNTFGKPQLYLCIHNMTHNNCIYRQLREGVTLNPCLKLCWTSMILVGWLPSSGGMRTRIMPRLHMRSWQVLYCLHL